MIARDLTTDTRFTLGCPHKVVMDRDPTQDRARMRPPSREAQLRRDEGVAFGREMQTRIAAAYGVDDLSTTGSAEERVARTMEAIGRKDAVVVGGRLPRCGEREGSPDLIVLIADGSYVPGDVKHHRGYEQSDARSPQRRRVAATVERLASPGAPGDGVRKVDERDEAQLCHYWVMLTSLGLTRGEPRGIIVNNEQIALWWELDAAMKTYQREYQSRLQTVTQVLEGVPDASHAILHEDCDECEWREVCEEAANAAGHFSVVGVSLKRGIHLESAKGIRTLNQLAKSDPAGLVAPGFTEQTAREHVDRARLMVLGETRPHAPRGGEPRPIPRAAVEVDFDAEWGSPAERSQERTYLWGTLTTRTDSTDAPTYRAFHSLDGEVNDDAKPLAAFWAWVSELRRDEGDDPARLRFYVYSGKTAERTRMLDVVEGNPSHPMLPTADEVKRFFESELLVDLRTHVNHYVWPTRKRSLKDIAPLLGASWRSAGAGGDWSKRILREACAASDASVRADRIGLLLQYNEDDVLATRVIRESLSRAQIDGSIPPISSIDGRFA